MHGYHHTYMLTHGKPRMHEKCQYIHSNLIQCSCFPTIVLTVEQAIYIVMGTNIGTSFTSSLVALTQVADRNQFRRAFAGSIILYIFNLLTVTVLLPVEWAFGYLYYLTKAIVDSMDLTDATMEDEGAKFLSVLTEPFLKLIIEVCAEFNLLFLLTINVYF